MSDTKAGNLYQEQFEQAHKLLKDRQLAKCIAQAKKNLKDLTLPRFYVIRNCILIVCALEDWDEADLWLRSAEQCYWTSFFDAKDKSDTGSLRVLSIVRNELDQLKEFKMEDITGRTKEEREKHWVEMQEMELQRSEEYARSMNPYVNFEEFDWSGMESGEEGDEAKNETETTPEHITLPIRPAGKVPSDTEVQVQTPSLTVNPSAEDGQATATTL